MQSEFLEAAAPIREGFAFDIRRAQNLYSHFLAPRTPRSSSAAASFGQQNFICTALNRPRSTSEAIQFWLPPPFSFASPSIKSKSVSVGLAGAMSFSMALSSAVEAKEPLAVELLPKDVVLYQYEACPFCNKVKHFWTITIYHTRLWK